MSERNPQPDLDRLADALEGLNRHRFMRLHDSVWRMMWYQFLRGLAFGFGTFLGASVLVSLVALFLAQFEFVPFLGEWITRILEEIDLSRPRP